MNVLMMVVDDLRPLFGEAYGTPEVKTPNFDRFLTEGQARPAPALPADAIPSVTPWAQ